MVLKIFFLVEDIVQGHVRFGAGSCQVWCRVMSGFVQGHVRFCVGSCQVLCRAMSGFVQGHVRETK